MPGDSPIVNGIRPSTEAVTQVNASTVTEQHVQRMLLAFSPADGQAVDLPADATYGVGVDIKRIAAPLTSPIAVRLSDGTSGIGSTAQRLHVSDGGVALATTPSAPGDLAATLTDGRKTVTTPGTALAVRASLACKWVLVTALKTNTDQVNVGGSGVLATLGGSTGSPLAAGESVTLPASNANLVYVDARVAGEGVSFTVGS